MDTLKVGTYSDDNPEKGRSEVRSFSELPLSAQPGQSCCRRSLIKRLWTTFGIFALGWFLLSCSKRAFDQSYHAWFLVDDGVKHPPLEEGHPNHCVNSTSWTTYYDEPSWALDYPFGAETSFSLPLDSDALYLISRGPFQHGIANIEQSSEVIDTVDVRVRVAYNDDKALEHAAVCRLERPEREHGVGIFTSLLPPHRHHRFPDDQLKFDVFLTLPAATDVPLSVKKLETTLPSYSYNVADLGKSVLFERISLSSLNGRISAKSITFNAGRFSVQNGEIDGHFNARSFLSLNTLNGAITPTVNLFHREGEGAPKLMIHSANGQIDAEISLTSEAPIGSEFDVDARLRSGDIGLKFTDTPVDSVLRCRAETITGGIEVELDSAFEGNYSLQSLLGKKILSQRNVEDPSGRERRRTITQNVSGRRVEGEVKWIESDGSSSENEGHVTLKALVSFVKLVV